MLRRLGFVSIVMVCMLAACRPGQHRFAVDVLNGFTPVKNQGGSQTCWIYAMLATIETEHIMRGDSVHLSAAFVERSIEQEPDAPSSKRGMGLTCIHLMQKYGVVPYDAMMTTDEPMPRHAYMYGVEYSVLEFARSVCDDGEYVALGTSVRHAYGATFEPDVPDNWEHNRLMNVPPDELMAIAERAVRKGHGVCWEGDTSERGFRWKDGVAETTLLRGTTTDDHCMAIVGLAHDERNRPYFVMKNSWGSNNRYGGLLFMSFDYFRQKTIAVYLSKDAL